MYYTRIICKYIYICLHDHGIMVFVKLIFAHGVAIKNVNMSNSKAALRTRPSPCCARNMQSSVSCC